MPNIDVAHIHEQGQDMLLFPLDGSFGHKTPSDQRAMLNELQAHARGAGLAGHAVAVWVSGGSTYTIGPERWRGFLQSIDMSFVIQNVNRKISW